MSRKYKIGDNTKIYFVTLTVVYWIDLLLRNSPMPSLQPKASVYKCLEDFRLQYHHGSKSIIPDQNPVKAGFVIYAEAWQYSSAADYSDERNDFIELLYVE